MQKGTGIRAHIHDVLKNRGIVFKECDCEFWDSRSPKNISAVRL